MTESKATVGRLYVLDIGGGIVFTMNPDGSGRKDIVTGCKTPDGVQVDVEAGHIYWTDMGHPKSNNGSIERADLDGQNRTTIIPEGGTFTPKQVHLEKKSGKLYWCDREGMRVMRSNLDGSQIETLVDSSQGDPRPGPDPEKWCVGIAVDPERGQFYWSQKGGSNAGQGAIFRAGLEMPEGETPATRSDIEVFYPDLPEPIDLELDRESRVLYWTDRGDPPRGNTTNRASVDAKPDEPEIVFDHLEEAIGLALDIPGDRMFMTDMAGSILLAPEPLARAGRPTTCLAGSTWSRPTRGRTPKPKCASMSTTSGTCSKPTGLLPPARRATVSASPRIRAMHWRRPTSFRKTRLSARGRISSPSCTSTSTLPRLRIRSSRRARREYRRPRFNPCASTPSAS
jgi:hypothetical protein